MPGERARRVSTGRLIRRLTWFWACAVLAALAAYVGLGALSRAVEPAPASVSAQALTAATAREAASGDPVVAAAGDIACDPSNSNFNGGNGVSNSCRQKAVSDLIFNQGYDGVLLLGDNQYYCGGYTAHVQSYDLSWGRFKSITKPSPGNHEYLTSGGTDCTSANAGADGYYRYFGALAGEKGKGYYSFDIGAWHVIVLNSHCSGAGGCSSSTPQGQFLRNELATHTNVCTLAYWHVPYYSSGGRDDATYKTFWDALYQYDADLVLSGHDHTYERFAPQTPSRTLDNVRGIRQFVVGTGGANHTSLATTMANSEVRNDDTFGVLKLTLRPTSYDWEFVPEPGKTFTDSGSTNCHGKSSDTTPPSTPTGLTATASSSNKVDLTWNPSTDNVSVEGYRVYRNGSLIATVTAGTSHSDTPVAARTSYSYTVAAYDAGLNASSQSAPAAVTTPGDTGVPSAPTSLAASSVAPTEVKLTWTASTDNVAVAGYRIFRDSVEIGTSSTPAYTDSTAQPEKTYSYFVRAYDAENNVSPNSNTISVTTPGLPSTLTFTPAADASIRSDLPATNYGSSSVIGIDSSPVEDLLLKFTVSGTAGRPIQSVKLRLYCNDSGGSGGVFKRVTDTSWSESGVNWGNAPAGGTTLATLGAVNTGSWYEVDVTPLVTGSGTYSLRVSGTSTNGTDYRSKEYGAGFAPQLVVTVQNVADSTPPTAPTNLVATAGSPKRVDLTWTASTDNDMVARYRIYRNLVQVGTSTTPSYTDTGVLPSTTYRYDVVAEDPSGNVSAASNTANVTTPADTTPPSAPANLTAAVVSPTRIDLTWNASTDDVGVHRYRIRRDGVQIATSLMPSYNDTTAAEGTSYSYTVDAIDAAGNASAPSNTATATTPVTPTTVTPAADSSLRSDLPSTNYGSATVIGIDSTPAQDLLLKFNVTGVNGRGVASAKLRLFCTEAGGSGGVFKRVADSSWSESSVTWGNAPAPEAATIATIGATTAGVWYEIDVTSAVTADGSVSFRASGTDANGTDYSSKEGTAGNVPQLIVTPKSRPPDTQPPTQPTALLATAPGPTRVDLGWTASTDNVGVAGYRIFRDGVQIATTTTASYSDLTAKPSTVYAYHVVAYDEANLASAPSNTANITTPADTTPPTAPSSLAAVVVNSTRVDLTWNASSDDVGVDRYRILRDGAQIATSIMPSYSDTTAAEGTSYSYTVDAVDAAGNISASSNTANATTPVATSAFTPVADTSLRADLPTTNYGTQAVVGIDSTPAEDLLLKFNVSGVNGRGVASAKLRLFCADAGGSGGTFKRAANSSWGETTVNWNNAPAVDGATLATIGPTSAGTWYEIDVTAAVTGDGLVSFRASSSDPNGTDYSSKEGTAGRAPQLVVTPNSGPPDTEPPSQPTTLLASAPSPTRVDLVWTASTDNVGIAGYRVYRDGAQIGTSTTAGYSDLTAQPNTSYAYHVIAYDAANNASAPSNTANITTLADTTAPTAPTSLTAVAVSQTRVDLTWGASADNIGVTDYRVFRGGTQIGTSTGTSYSDTTVVGSTTYNYQVAAVDAASNQSALSNTATVTTASTSLLKFQPTGDATIQQDFPTTASGTGATIMVDNSPVKHMLLKFTVSGVGGRTVSSAKLRLHCTNQSGVGGVFARATTSSWSEATVTWNTAPAAGSTIRTLGAVAAGSWYEVDVTSVITGDGTYSLRVSSTSADGAEYSSKEGANRPELVVDVP